MSSSMSIWYYIWYWFDNFVKWKFKKCKIESSRFVKVLCHELIKSYLYTKKTVVIDCLSCDPDNIVWNFL